MIDGHCECGDIRFEINGEIKDYAHCHCSQCRRTHGAAFATFAGVDKSAFSIVQGEDSLTSYASSEELARTFCKRCGSNIVIYSDEEPDTVYVSMGAVNGNPPHPPVYHIFVGSKAPWYEITDDAPQMETYSPDYPGT